MARRARVDKAERVLLHIRGSLMTKVRLVVAGMPQYRDPLNPSVPKRGALSEVANAALQQWLDKQTGEQHAEDVRSEGEAPFQGQSK